MAQHTPPVHDAGVHPAAGAEEEDVDDDAPPDPRPVDVAVLVVVVEAPPVLPPLLQLPRETHASTFDPF
jgi:hypothetical protein